MTAETSLRVMMFAILLVVGARIVVKSGSKDGGWHLPELALGLAISTIGIGLICMFSSGFAEGTVEGVNRTLLGISVVSTSTGLSLVFVFTWRTFHPNETWAALLAAGGSIGIFVSWGAVYASVLAGDPHASAYHQGEHWLTFDRLILVVNFGWTSFEGFRYYRVMRRRGQLGLADPMTVNRFMLWGVGGLFAATLILVNTFYGLLGANTFSDTVPSTILAIGASLACGSYYLTFFPPAAFERMIRRRAAELSAA